MSGVANEAGQWSLEEDHDQCPGKPRGMQIRGEGVTLSHYHTITLSNYHTDALIRTALTNEKK